MDVPLKKKRFNKSKITMIVGAGLLVLLIVFVIVATSGKSRLNVDVERISISNVESGLFQENISVTGNVLPITTFYLDALEGGIVEEIFVEDGAIMKHNDPILKLSNTDLELSLVNQETSVYNLLTQMQISQNAARQNTINKLNRMTDVENALVEAERQYMLSKKLFEAEAIGSQEFKESQNNYTYQKQRMELAREVLQQDSISVKQEANQSRSLLARTQSALELMRKKVGDLIVRAPADGQLTSLDAEIGQSKNKGDRLGQLDVLSGYKIRVDVDEHYISRIYTGQVGTFTFNGETYKLIIKKVFTQVTSGRFQVDMQFEGDVPEGIRRGQSLQIRLTLSEEKQAVMVSKGGFFQQTGGNWIFKLSDDGKMAYRINIQLGSQNTTYYEVLEGLKPGDKVITSSYDNFGDKEELILK
ncbi:efflux RND transporter periplasmic adaptor subunit [Aestuariivivens sp. NBU2969]|uniref:efflux RND transporter periplasmic adaptor subunit n=1 Tax=Aestuariivivens sp. NBU2969 TaxID=2873267 RepID=UPI001CBDBB4C|nr:efflux RND transporter periplasmic adaptor subunit [Aestuariivivens sp. NBU2969]